jgi:hypothetical protein
MLANFRSIKRTALLCLVALSSVRAQAPATQTPFARAQTALNAGKPDSAIAMLEPYFQANPNSQIGWLLLGTAYKQKGDVARAMAAFEKAASIRASRAPGWYNMAMRLAAKGSSDSALALLHRVKSLGTFDMEAAMSAPDFAALRSDPRFAATQFRPEDFTKPFVEPVRVIHEWAGETKGDQFSWIARGIGDVDGDRVNDVVASAPSYATTGTTSRGRVYVYSGKSGTLLWQFTGDSADAVGTGLEGTGDVNRDGAPDLVAGAPGTGRAYVLSGKDGKVIHILRGTVGEAFGNASGAAGDQDGDGIPDVIVGAPGGSGSNAGPGKAYVFSGKTGALVLTLTGERDGDGFGSIVAGNKAGRATPMLVGAPRAGEQHRGRVYSFSRTNPSKPNFVFDADSTGTALGAMFTSFVGDVNGDKVLDVYATDFTNAARGPGTGRVYVRSGVDGRLLHTFTGEHPGDGFGVGAADVGDVNKDGHDDLLIGAWQYASVAGSGGRIYLFSGKDGSVLRTITGRVPGETLGFDSAGIGDVDGDGVPDFLVASSWSNIRGFHSGRMYIISGREK